MWLATALLIPCAPAQAMQVDLSADIQGERAPTIKAATNLPDAMKLLVRVTREESAFQSETPVEVQSGHFEVSRSCKAAAISILALTRSRS